MHSSVQHGSLIQGNTNAVGILRGRSDAALQQLEEVLLAFLAHKVEELRRQRTNITRKLATVWQSLGDRLSLMRTELQKKRCERKNQQR